MTAITESAGNELSEATPLDMYRAIDAYRWEHIQPVQTLGIRTELFDGDADLVDVQVFAYGITSETYGRFSVLGMLSVADGIDAHDLAHLHRQMGRGIRNSDQDTTAELLNDGGYLAVAASRMALRGIGVEYHMRREQWRDEDVGRIRQIGWASLAPEIYAANNIRQHRAGIRGPSYKAGFSILADWNGIRDKRGYDRGVRPGYYGPIE